MNNQEGIIIRKKRKTSRAIVESLVFVLSWGIQLGLIILAISFLSKVYSDDLVVLYLIFNFDYGLFLDLLKLLVVLFVSFAIAGGMKYVNKNSEI